MPEGKWYDLFTDTVHQGNNEALIECPMEKLPVFVKQSGILALQSQTYHTAEKSDTTLELHLYKGVEENTFNYYEDDGESYDFQSGAYYQREITYDPNRQAVVFSRVEGQLESKYSEVKLYYHGFTSEELTSLTPNQEDYRFIQQLSNFDPIDESPHGDYVIENLLFTTHSLIQDEFTINW